MKKNMVCVAILFTGLLLCITLMTGGGSDAEDSTSVQNEQPNFLEYTVCTSSDDMIVGGSVNTTESPIPTDIVTFVVKDVNGTIVSKYTLECILDSENSTFEIVVNSLKLISDSSYKNAVVIIPQNLTHSAHTDSNGEKCKHSDGSYACTRVNPLGDIKSVETLIIQGSPVLGKLDGGYQFLNKGGSLRYFVIADNPTYSLGENGKYRDLINVRYCSNLQGVYFLSSGATLPSKIATSNSSIKTLDVYLSSSGNTQIPATLFAPYRDATADNCATVNLHFSRESTTPASFGDEDAAKMPTKHGITNFIIDVKSRYWLDYLGSMDVAGSVITNDYSMITVTGTPTHLITYSVSEGGKISVAEEAAEGQTVVVNVVPINGYYLKELRCKYGSSNETVADDNGYRFEMPDSDVELVAVFEKCIPTIESKHVVSGSQVSIDVDFKGNPSNGKTPVSASIYVKYAGDVGDVFTCGIFKMPVYSDGYSISYSTSMTSVAPVSYLIQVFAADGTCLNQKEVSISE